MQWLKWEKLEFFLASFILALGASSFDLLSNEENDEQTTWYRQLLISYICTITIHSEVGGGKAPGIQSQKCVVVVRRPFDRDSPIPDPPTKAQICLCFRCFEHLIYREFKTAMLPA